LEEKLYIGINIPTEQGLEITTEINMWENWKYYTVEGETFGQGL